MINYLNESYILNCLILVKIKGNNKFKKPTIRNSYLSSSSLGVTLSIASTIIERLASLDIFFGVSGKNSGLKLSESGLETKSMLYLKGLLSKIKS